MMVSEVLLVSVHGKLALHFFSKFPLLVFCVSFCEEDEEDAEDDKEDDDDDDEDDEDALCALLSATCTCAT
jgi:hypothetical protein